MPASSGIGGLVSFAGLTSGLDSTAIIKAMMNVAHLPIDQLTAQEQVIKQHETTYSNISGLLQNLATAAHKIAYTRGYNALKAVSSNVSVAQATLGTGAQAGTYALSVQNLATAQRTYSDPVADANQTGLFGTGTITLTAGADSPISITVDNTTTLTTLASSINGAGAGVTASIMYDGSQYRLQVSGTQTGAANAFSFAENGTTLNLSSAANQKQAAQDASFSLDGYSVTRPTNVVNDIITGMTLQLNQTGTTTLSIAPDTGAIQTQIDDMITAYNAVIGAINTAQSFNLVPGKADKASMSGDSLLRGLEQQLQSVIAGSFGSDPTLTGLSQIGIATQKDGTLLVDDTKLQAAIGSNPTGVQNLFIFNTTANTRGAAQQLDDVSYNYQQMITAQNATLSQQVGLIDDRIRNLSNNLQLYQKTLKAQFDNLEMIMSKLQSQGNAISQLQRTREGA